MNYSVSKSHGLVASQWCRWTRYEIRDGCIRPAPGAKLRRYNPWKLWLETRPVGRRSDSTGEAPTPYRALLEMLRTLEYRSEYRLHSNDGPRHPPMRNQLKAPLTAASEQAVLDWCAKYGSLGILPHRVLHVTLAPGATDQVQYIRIGTGWSAALRHRHNPNASVQQPRAIVHSVADPTISVETLSTTWARFFPDVPVEAQETFPYPLPLSKPFWEIYGEPLDEFLSGARALQDLLSGIKLQGARPLRAFQKHTGGAFAMADSLVAPMGLGVRISPSGRVDLNFVGNSLLATFTVMLLEDLSRGKAMQCPCGQLFVSSAYQAHYCSKRCRWRFEQRQFRSSKRRASRTKSSSP